MICIEIPAKNSGRFRFKTSESGKAFDGVFKRGQKFAPNVYLEWMISYDNFLMSRLNGVEFKKHVLKLNIFRYDMDDTFVNVVAAQGLVRWIFILYRNIFPYWRGCSWEVFTLLFPLFGVAIN